MTLTVHRIGAGDGYRYYTRMVTSGDRTRRPGEALADYYARSGEAPGVWLGRGAASMSVNGEVRETQLANLLGLGLHPDTGEQLGTRYRIYATVQERIASRTEQLSQTQEIDESTVAAVTAEELLKGERQAVAGFDLTFSPVKSVSVAWGLASQQVADQLLAAHRFAVTSTLGWLEDEVITARAGADGIAHVDVTGVTVAGFEHRTSRAGDPDLHTHAVVSNKVLATLHDGSQKWLTLDSRSLYKATVTASERYNRVLAEGITRRLGWRFAVRADQDPEAVSPIWELEFMPAALIAGFSKRRAQVEAGYAERVAAYRLDHGHEPPRHVQFALAQDACLASRPDKDDTTTPDSERRAWAEFATSIVTPAERRALHDALTPAVPGEAVDGLDRFQVEATAGRVLDQMEQRRSDWTARHLTSAAHRLTADVTFSTDTARDREIARIVTAASQSDPRSVRVTAPDVVATPGHLTRRDGQSVWEAPASERFTTHRVLDAEADLVAGAREEAPVRADAARLSTVLQGFDLAADQSAAVEQLVTGDRRLQLLVGPAGTGKTTTMRALVAVWQRAVGGPVSGLAPTAVAAGVLRDETGMDTTATIDLWATRRAHGVRGGSFGEGELVIVDEAGMAGTLILQEVLAAARADGAQVLLVGDPRQLAAVDAGGALRLIQHDVGAAELSTVWRFSDTHPQTGKRVIRQWEADASLALRVGDHRAINTYIEHGRVHDGTCDHALDQLYVAWRADTDAGLDAIMIAGDNATVQALSARARTDRITAGLVDPSRGGVNLRNGGIASVGDRVVTRRNDRANLRVGGTDFVKNGDLWTVQALTASGGLVVTGRAGRVTLPPDYVTTYVELGYAVTVHRAQGVTVDTAHTLADDSLTRETLYVAATRGRAANHLYCVTEHLLDAEAERPANPGQPALAVLTRALDRTQASESATQSIRDEQHRAASTRTHLTRWQYITDHLPQPIGRAAVTAALPAWAARQLLDDPQWPDLGRYLEWVGADHAEQLVRRVWANPLVGQRARCSAAILLPRLAREHASTVTDGDWLPRPFTATAGNLDLEYANHLLAAAQDRAAHLGRLAADQPPQWAAALGPAPVTDGPDREQWTRRAGYVAAYRETYNIDGHGPLGQRPDDPLQRQAWTHALTALPRTDVPRSQAALATAKSTPAQFRPPSADLPYLHLPNPAERLAAIRADVNALTDRIQLLGLGPGQPGRHEKAWFQARGRDLRARHDYLQPVLAVRDDAAADLTDATKQLQQALETQAQCPNPDTTETADGVDLFVAQTGARWQVESARARVEEARKALAGAEAALDLHAKRGPLSPAGAIVTRTDIDREQYLASSLDVEELAELKHRLDELKNGPLWRAEQAARRHESLSVSPAHIDGVAPPEVGALAAVTDDQLAALHRAVEQQHASHYAAVRTIRTALATITARDAESPDTPGPREQQVLRQIQDWNGVLARLRAAATTEADATSAERDYLNLTSTQPLPPADDISAARTTAITARAAALHANHGLPENQHHRDQARNRATEAIATLTSQQHQAADADRDEPTILTEQLIETAQHLQDARSHLDQITAELTRRLAADTPANPLHTVTSKTLIDQEEWHRRRDVTHHDTRSNDRTQQQTAQRRIEPVLSVDCER